MKRASELKIGDVVYCYGLSQCVVAKIGQSELPEYIRIDFQNSDIVWYFTPEGKSDDPIWMTETEVLRHTIEEKDTRIKYLEEQIDRMTEILNNHPDIMSGEIGLGWV